jgi:hypothetical protein
VIVAARCVVGGRALGGCFAAVFDVVVVVQRVGEVVEFAGFVVGEPLLLAFAGVGEEGDAAALLAWRARMRFGRGGGLWLFGPWLGSR